MVTVSTFSNPSEFGKFMQTKRDDQIGDYTKTLDAAKDLKNRADRRLIVGVVPLTYILAFTEDDFVSVFQRSSDLAGGEAAGVLLRFMLDKLDWTLLVQPKTETDIKKGADNFKKIGANERKRYQTSKTKEYKKQISDIPTAPQISGSSQALVKQQIDNLLGNGSTGSRILGKHRGAGTALNAILNPFAFTSENIRMKPDKKFLPIWAPAKHDFTNSDGGILNWSTLQGTFDNTDIYDATEPFGTNAFKSWRAPPGASAPRLWHLDLVFFKDSQTGHVDEVILIERLFYSDLVNGGRVQRPSANRHFVECPSFESQEKKLSGVIHYCKFEWNEVSKEFV